MPGTQIFIPENRLAKIVSSLTGARAADLVGDADSRLATLKDSIQSYVAVKLRELLAYADYGDVQLVAECRILAQAAVNIAEVAGAAEMESLGEIACGIGAMVDELLTTGTWHTEALRLHIRSLGLVRHGAHDRSPENRLIVENLAQMRRVLGVRD